MSSSPRSGKAADGAESPSSSSAGNGNSGSGLHVPYSSDEAPMPNAHHIAAAMYDEEKLAKDENSAGDRGAVETHECKDDAPRPDSYLHEDDHIAKKAAGSSSAGLQLGSSTNNELPLSNAMLDDSIMGSKLDESRKPAPVSSQDQSQTQGQSPGVQRLPITSATTSNSLPAPSAPPRNDDDEETPATPILEATLVVDEPAPPIVDAIPLEERSAEEDDEEDSIHPRKKRQKLLIAGLVVIIGILAIVVGVAFSSRSDNTNSAADNLGEGDEGEVSSTESNVSISPTPTQIMAPEATTTTDTTESCSEVQVKDVQSSLESRYKSTVLCECLSSSSTTEFDSVVSCLIPYEESCKEYSCNEGWTCPNEIDSVWNILVPVCEAVIVEEQWAINKDTDGYTRIKVIDHRYYTKGVSNIQSRSVETDKTTNPASCSGYNVDGKPCKSCDVCEVDDNNVVTVAADCSNIRQYAAARCDKPNEVRNFLQELLVLDSESTAPIPRLSFCKSLADLETYMTTEFASLMNKSFNSRYKCQCTNEMELQFTVSCSLEYGDGGELFVNREQMLFEMKQGEYKLVSTSWSDSSMGPISIAQEEFIFDHVASSGGKLTSCTANACTSCTICEDGKSVAVDCSTIGANLGYTYKCSEKYTGSFANSYNFGVISD